MVRGQLRSTRTESLFPYTTLCGSDIDGDVYAAGQSVTISGTITGDVIAAAQAITSTGTVDGDIRLAGQTVTIDGDVTGSGTVFGADLVLAEAGSFGHDLVGEIGRAHV